MYTVTKGVYVDFAHHIKGHRGPCINIHGHTWFFEATLQAEELDANGFVVDFKQLKRRVLNEVHQLFDHGFVLSVAELEDLQPALATIGAVFLKQQGKVVCPQAMHRVCDVVPKLIGGIKIVAVPFTPTCERLAKWFFGMTKNALGNKRVKVHCVRVYESLHPVPAFAEYAAEEER